MRIEDWDVIHDMMVAATVELFDSLALPISYRGPVSLRAMRWSESLSIIGLTGPLRGALVLSIPAELVSRCHPTRSGAPEDLGDWLAELANLLLGRVKSKLLVHGVSIELSLPLTISATAFRFERFSGAPVVYGFVHGDCPLQVALEAIGDQDLQLGPARAAAAIPVGEFISF